MREIRADLGRQGIRLTDGSVSVLRGHGRGLSAAHRQGPGGCSCAGTAGAARSTAVKVYSENAAELQPAIKDVIHSCGQPVANMGDLGGAGAKAVADCRLEAVPDLVCH